MPNSADTSPSILLRAVVVLLTAMAALLLTSCCQDNGNGVRALPPGTGPTVCHKDFQSISKMPPIPIGCKFPECCPTCAVTDPIDLAVKVDGEMIQHVALTFGDASGSAVPIGQTSSAAQQNYPAVVEVDQAGMQLRAIGPADGGPLLFLYPRIQLGEVPRLEAASQQSDWKYQYEDVVYPIRVEIEQWQDGALIKKDFSEYQIVNCTDFELVHSDIVDVQQNRGDDVSVVLASGKRQGEGCVSNYPHRISKGSAVGNYLSVSEECYNEISVYSDDDAISLLAGEEADSWSRWSGHPWDMQPARLAEPRWRMPVKVWVVAREDQREKLFGWAQDDLLLGDDYLNLNHAGIDILSQSDIEILQDECEAGEDCLIDDLLGKAWTIYRTCFPGVIDDIKANPAIYDSSSLNVYYVDDVRISGAHCRIDGHSANIALVGRGSKPETLVHEIGHALSLRHADKCIAIDGIPCASKVSKDHDNDGESDFTDENVMWSGGTGRFHFAEGQGFRMTFDKHSLLNASGTRVGGPSSRDCPDDVINDQCPSTGLDYSPN